MVNHISHVPNSNYWTNRPNMPNSIRKSVEPFLLPYDHPVRQHLDHICRNYAPYDIDSLTRNYSGHPGCRRLNEGGRNVMVLTHPRLTVHGLMIKAPLPITAFNLTRKDNHLLRRVEGHHFGNDYVAAKNLKHIKVTNSWLYPVPLDASFVEWFVDFIARPFRIALKCLGLKCPSWLKYADRVLSEKFVVVEELIDIKEFNIDQLNSLSRETVDECIELIPEVGFGDTVEKNFSLDKDKVTLFDLDQFSHKQAKRQENGKAGVVYMFRNAEAHDEYVRGKLGLSDFIMV